ncbi:Kelch motif containing protein [Penicillium ucsense]|uniref:Kelch motif containing protein n=1 Tax=Penicillium ucsense TaxID=2839758 RepID=A0A8J8W7Q2_9EURO|nr:Kelch motif containing protein [Penicillium ucsense]KAF7736001.1 Kelch motif containing protein [Penicillium ucsense]
MAFLFKSKKSQQGSALPPASRNVHTSEGAPSASGPPPAMNGVKDGNAFAQQTPTTSSSYNSSLNSAASPTNSDPIRVRQRAESESQVQRPPHQPPLNGVAPAGANASLYPWSQRRLNFPAPQANPFPRYGAAINAVASKEGDIYMMGGLIDGSTVKGDLWMIESSGGSLSCFQIATVSEGPGPRVGHASLLVGNAFIVFGGDTKINETDALDDTLYLLNTSSRQWSRAIPPGPRPSGRYGHTLNILGSKLYVFGGQVEGFFFNDLIAFDLNQLQNPTNKWELLVQNSHEGGPPEGEIPPARTNHTLVSHNDRLYLFGGTNGVKWFNDVWTFDPRANSWTELDCVGFIPTPREGHAAALVNDVMYVFGGRTDEGIDLGDLSAFRITSRRWYSFQNMGPAPSPRSGHSMTAFGKQIIVMAGEPSSGTRDPIELSTAYILDTGKIRYPNDSQSSERGGVPAGRKISTDKQMITSGRTSREAQNATPDQLRRGPTPSRESSAQGPMTKPGELGPSPNMGPGSRLPRASIAQAPAGPPPPGQAPSPGPRANGAQPAPVQTNPRSKTPTKNERGFTPTVDVRAANADRDVESPVAKDISTNTGSPGPRTPTQPSQKVSAKAMEAGEAAPMMTPARQRSLRQSRQRGSMDSGDESVLSRRVASIDGSIESRSIRGSRTPAEEPRSPRLTAHHEALIKELEAAKARNAWYASELSLAKKAGYVSNSATSPVMDERINEVVNDEDRPLVEAFLAMRAELAKMQATVDRQAAIASKRIAEVEHQRDVAVGEAAYSRTRLAAHGGSQRGTPQPDASRDGEEERPGDMSRRLAAALASQAELKTKIDSLTSELEQERQAKDLAEDTIEATRKRLAELEMSNSTLEAENLRAELHKAEATAREEALLRAEAEASLKQLIIDKEELMNHAEESSGRLKDFSTNFDGLREAVAASTAKTAIVEKQLHEERERREGLERKLLQLRSEYEEQTTELENITRRLRDAEELAEISAKEAETHKFAFVSGLERAASVDLENSFRSRADQRVAALEAQVERSTALAKSNQAAADAAAEKLRRAEERIAGLEAYQEQASREGLQLRRQLQNALKESQAATTESRELRSQLETHQRDANALNVQHAALKDLLGERGMSTESRRSPRLESPGSRFGTPEQSRLRELEQQLSNSLKAHEDLKSSFEVREQEADRAFREKLEQLENDYQSAVHYVKGTEKMLKRMKDELSRYKSQNAKLQSEVEASQKSSDEDQLAGAAAADWEAERAHLQKSIADLEANTSSSLQSLETQISELQVQLREAEAEKDQAKANYERAQRELEEAANLSRAELEQLKKENVHLESRATDAEQKVNLLLEQVETSVGHYRRQSHLGQGPNGISRTHSNASSNTIGGRARADSTLSQDSTAFPDNRGSMALDSLANELEALRSHWESTNRNYRLSSQLDLERTPTKETSDGPAAMSDSLAEWRRRLDEEERTGNTKTTSEAPSNMI